MAKTFGFYQDRKVTIWSRDYFSVEAETREDAIKRIEELNLIKTDVFNIIADDVYPTDSEMLYDTEEMISVEDNLGNQTAEIWEDNGGKNDVLLYHNAE